MTGVDLIKFAVVILKFAKSISSIYHIDLEGVPDETFGMMVESVRDYPEGLKFLFLTWTTSQYILT